MSECVCVRVCIVIMLRAFQQHWNKFFIKDDKTIVTIRLKYRIFDSDTSLDYRSNEYKYKYYRHHFPSKDMLENLKEAESEFANETSCETSLECEYVINVRQRTQSDTFTDMSAFRRYIVQKQQEEEEKNKHIVI